MKNYCHFSSRVLRLKVSVIESKGPLCKDVCIVMYERGGKQESSMCGEKLREARTAVRKTST